MLFQGLLPITVLFGEGNDVIDCTPQIREGCGDGRVSLCLSFTSANTQENAEVLDVISNPYAVDAFVNQCILDNNFCKQVFVKVSGKNVLNKTDQRPIL